MDKISAMKAYVKVVESTSFTGAAEVLHTSAVYVTRMVQALESDLGVKLLEPNNPPKQADRCRHSLLRTLRRAAAGSGGNGRRRSGF